MLEEVAAAAAAGVEPASQGYNPSNGVGHSNGLSEPGALVDALDVDSPPDTRCSISTEHESIYSVYWKKLKEKQNQLKDTHY